MSDKHQILLGAYVNPHEDWGDVAEEREKLSRFEMLSGRRLGLVLRYHKWSDDLDGELVRDDLLAGRLPLITWGSPDQRPTLAEINAGDWDELASRQAQALKSLAEVGSGRVLLRPLWEMNGNWSAWDGTHSGPGRARQFIRAWRRLRRLFAEAGADNVEWVWSPNVDSWPQKHWNRAEAYYPGDKHVDWVGLDGYNWGEDHDTGWREFLELFKPLHDRFAGKPIIISETACAEEGGDKAAWIRGLEGALDELPSVRAVVWFHSDKERDWRIDSSPEALVAFRALAKALSEERPVLDPPRGPTTFDVRAKNIGTVLAVFLTVYTAQNIFWDYPRQAGTQSAGLWVWLGLLWCIPILSALLGLAGLLSFRRPGTPVESVDNLVSFRFVSRGTNIGVLRSSVESVHEQMSKHPLFPYVIEVVTDSPIDLGQHPNLRYLVVPSDWQTENGSLYKARALHYACCHSTLPDDAWIMHCDEESHASGSLVSGIAQAVLEEETSGRHRIGQGVILYHRNRRHHPLTFLADMIRTGDDYGRYSLQARLGWPLFGFHGSFVLVRNSVSQAVGFDFGPDGSITEDAFWSLVQMQRGVRCRFVDGFMIEQSPQSMRDFVKQRRRWFLGLYKVVTKAPVPVSYRLLLASLIGVWSLGWLVIVYTLLNFYIGYQTPLVIRLGGDLAFTYFFSTYLIGLRVNLEESPTGALRTFGWAVAQLVTLPLHTVLEAAGVLYGIVKPDMGFHVIAKDAEPSLQPDQQPQQAFAGARPDG